MLEAVRAIRSYTRPGRSAFMRSPIVRDAVIARIIQLGEAVKGAQAGGLDLERLAPGVPWGQIAGMRDILSHQYWRTDPEIIWAVVAKDLKPLEAAVKKLPTGAKRRASRAR